MYPQKDMRNSMPMANSRHQTSSSDFKQHSTHLQQYPDELSSGLSSSRMSNFLPAPIPMQSHSDFRTPRTMARSIGGNRTFQNLSTRNQSTAGNVYKPVAMKPILSNQRLTLPNQTSIENFKRIGSGNVVGSNAVERSFWNSKLNHTSVRPGSNSSINYGDQNYKPVHGALNYRMDDTPQRTNPTVQPAATITNNENLNRSMETTEPIQASSNTNNLPKKVFGSTDREKLFIFTGSVENIIRWNKIFCNHFCYFEVIGAIISIQEGTIREQKVMLLRDKKGPVLQVVYYSNTYINIGDFFVGKLLRVVGNMIGPNVLKAVSIRSAADGEVENLQRLSLICEQAISHYINA